MVRKGLSVLFAIMLLPLPVFAAGPMAISLSPSRLSPGETLFIFFSVSEDGPVDLVVLDRQGTQRAAILEQYEAKAGGNELTWDGTNDGSPLPAGNYMLHLIKESQTVDMEVAIGSAGEAGAVNGENESEAETPGGTDDPQEAPEVLNSSETAITPAHLSAYTISPKHQNCYWCTPMDIKDEEAVWGMLAAPVTIVEGEQKRQVVLRAQPDNNAEGVGVVTCASQGVHVLENLDNGWSLVETYSSSFHDSKVKAWNAFVIGYIPTDRLKTKQPNTDYGLVIDKLTQEIYIFRDGKYFTKLLISTGLYNERQPYNETRSGEFLIVSRVGMFRSDNMFCSMALRFNSGDLLHEVPHVKNADGGKNYSNTEYKLGTRASHGCIRVQRRRNDEGVNMSWIWDNIKVNTKLVIWEDYAGRQMDFPDPSTPLYYNPDGGTSYHSTANCSGVRDKYLPLAGTVTYGALKEGQYAKLTPCTYCSPPRSYEEIEAINEIHRTQSPGMVPQVPAKKK